jgi:hypothetical protein
MILLMQDVSVKDFLELEFKSADDSQALSYLQSFLCDGIVMDAFGKSDNDSA